MDDLYYGISYYLVSIFSKDSLIAFTLVFIPFVIFLEVPFTILNILFATRAWLKIHYQTNTSPSYTPLVSIVITAYREPYDTLKMTVQSIVEQLYAGKIEILIIVDNAPANPETIFASNQLQQQFKSFQNRRIIVVPKENRGGHANSMNLGLKLARGEVIFLVDADTSLDNQTVLKALHHFNDPNVIAVSGALRVRNTYDSWLTRFQAIEYMIGIQLGRFGLTEIKATNNISGAFGIFRRSFLLKLKGWLNGTAEDLDLMLRIHAYHKRYPNLKIVHEPLAIAWTDAPSTLKMLMLQRLRWDGDLYYIYVRRHWRKFTSKLLGGVPFILTAWYGLYYQLALPLIIVAYYIVLYIQFSVATIIAVMILIYGYYLMTSLILFALFLLLVSERPKQDARLIPWFIVMPFYQQVMRLMSAIFIMNEIIFSGHQDTSMAPWWIIKKTK